jgi:murein L,D-transpeptidase YcbB/YkuD
MRVIVGKAQQSRTPVFSDKMTYLVLNPAWNIPDDIIDREIRPALQKDSGYLARKNIQAVKGWNDDAEAVDSGSVDPAALGKSIRLRQAPGPDNPLGQVKFMFPNQFDVYLHDTPADHLFKAEERDFSHGCIRLEKPIDLADYLLKDDPKWTPEAIQEVIDSGETKIVSIPRPLPVHILYFTAWADPDGTVEFRRDVYGHDAKLVQALAQEPPVALDFDAVRGQVKAGLSDEGPEKPAGRPTSS